MKKKLIFVLLILIVAVIGLSTIYAATEDNDSSNKTTLLVESQHPVAINKMINSISVDPFFKNRDQNVLDWLKGLDSNFVIFSTKDYYIVMNSSDAAKLPVNSNTGISVNSNINCTVLENKSLGRGLNNIIYVGDVEVGSEDLKNFDFGNK